MFFLSFKVSSQVLDTFQNEEIYNGFWRTYVSPMGTYLARPIYPVSQNIISMKIIFHGLLKLIRLLF